MKDSQYIHIEGWMGTRLGLKANDLICFAVIYGFSMDGESQFKGNLNYLAACIFATQPTVILALNHLLECNLILKQDDVVKGKKRCYYSTNVIYNEGKFEVIDTTKEPLVMTTKESLVMTTKESLPKEYNNKEYNKKNKKGENNKSFSPKNKRFVKPTINQIDEYIKEKDMHFEAERFFDYYESKGWMVGKSPMKDWKAACRTWESQRKHEFKEEPTEETAVIYPEGMTIEKWTEISLWMSSTVSYIAGRITPVQFDDMLRTCGDNVTLANMLTEINAWAEFHRDDDVYEEFKRRIKDSEL